MKTMITCALILTSLNGFAGTGAPKHDSRKVSSIDMKGPRAQSLYYNLLALKLSGGSVTEQKLSESSSFLQVKNDQGDMECTLSNPQKLPLFDVAADNFTCVYY